MGLFRSLLFKNREVRLCNSTEQTRKTVSQRGPGHLPAYAPILLQQLEGDRISVIDDVMQHLNRNARSTFFFYESSSHGQITAIHLCTTSIHSDTYRIEGVHDQIAPINAFLSIVYRKESGPPVTRGLPYDFCVNGLYALTSYLGRRQQAISMTLLQVPSLCQSSSHLLSRPREKSLPCPKNTKIKLY